MTSDNSLICFKAISNFTTELGNLFSTKQRSLKLYCRLINKTTLSHDKPIQKHIKAFKHFCVSNRSAIKQKNVNSLVSSKITYSQRVYIDINHIFTMADKDTCKVIWLHLLKISALVDPAGKAKEILKDNLAKGNSGEQETEFLTDIINKVEEHVDPSANPMEAITSIMSSGVFTELIGGMNDGFSNGTMDIQKLMGAVNGMMGTLGKETKGNPQAENMMSMVTGMMENLGNPNGQPPDIGKLMGQLMQPKNDNPSTEIKEVSPIETVTEE